jgi:hypothetical protein
MPLLSEGFFTSLAFEGMSGFFIVAALMSDQGTIHCERFFASDAFEGLLHCVGDHVTDEK